MDETRVKKKRSPISEYFASRLRQLREAAAITRYRLAQLTGMSQAYLGALERGTKQPSLATARTLAHALGHRLDVWEE